MKLVFATHNKGKIAEMKKIMSGINLKIVSADEVGIKEEIVEDGITFEENAIKKAITVAKFTGKPSLADDSGLEVYALKGAPGTLSARYAGEGADDRKNV
jgi:XTP/dITP diphosphohydrolase